MFVDYAYTFAISACKEDLCDFLLLAYKLEVPELVEWCIHQAALWYVQIAFFRRHLNSFQ